MAVPSILTDGRTGQTAQVTKQGQLVTAPIDFNEIYSMSMTVISTAYNFIAPKTNKRFVIDGVIFSGSRTVTASTGALIEIYESDSATNTTASKELLTLDINRLESKSIMSINALASEGVFINAKTDDATTFVSILGYFIEA